MSGLFARIKRRAHLVVVVVLALSFVLFVLQNSEHVQISFLFWSFSISRALMLLATLLLGVALGLLFMLGRKTGKNTPTPPARNGNKDGNG
jgi:uncharacterized integral membrane protein